LFACFRRAEATARGALSARKRKKARFAGEREVDLGAAAYISYNITSVHINQGWVRNNDLMGAASEEPTFTEVQSHRK